MAEQSLNSCDNDDWVQLHRFLCYGSDKGVYHVQESDTLTLETAACVVTLEKNGFGENVVQEIVKFSKDNLAVKVDPQLYALAICAKLAKERKTRTAAFKAVIDVCSSACQLFRFVEFTEKISGKTTGWGRGQKKAISEWYIKRDSKQLAVDITRYIQRNGWSHLDLIRLSHIQPDTGALGLCLKYVVKGIEAANQQYGSDGPSVEVTSLLAYLQAVDTVKHSSDPETVARLIEQYKLSKEHVPTTLLNSKEVWSALLQHMPLQDMLGYLGKITSLGMLDSKDSSSQTISVTEKLKDETLIKECKLQPFQVFLASKTYDKGKLEKGKQKCSPNTAVQEALKTTLALSFKNVEATGKRFLIAIDNSALSLTPVIGSPLLLTEHIVATLSMAAVRSEKSVKLVGYSNNVKAVDLTATMSMKDVTEALGKVPSGDSHDCAKPITWAMDSKTQADVFIIFTSGAKLGSIHPVKAISDYRTKLNLPETRLIVCSLTQKNFSLGSNTDRRILDMVGFDEKVPHLMYNFITGEL